MLKILELFGGIGACSKALERLGIDYEIADYVEIDKYAVKSFNAIHNTNFEPQDICKWDKDIKVDLIMHGSPCVTADSLILTKDGYKQIIDVNVGEEVLTKSNTWHKVLKKFDNGIAPTGYLNGMGFENIHCTPNHKFYVREMYRKGHKSIRTFKEPTFKEVKDITKNDYFGIPVMQEEISFHTNDLDFWYMLGMYMGDGWLSRNSNDIIIACNDYKLEKLKSKLDINKWKYTINDNGSCWRVRFANKDIHNFIQRYIGTGSEHKHIPYEILALPKEQLQEFYNGYLDTDGCIINGKHQFSSINREMIYSFGLIINKLYHRPVCLYKIKTKPITIIEGRVVNQKDWYQLRFNPVVNKQDHAFYEDGYIWYPFKNYELDVEQHVYNMEVEEDHSYIIQGCISKNCQDFSLAGKQAGGDKDSGTRSSLMYETIRIVEKLKPKYVIWENVKNLLSKKHRHNFNAYLEAMKQLGYTNYYQVLNAKDYGIPQNRERVFTVSILGNEKKYDFPKGNECNNKIDVVGNYMPSGHDASRIVDENGLAPTVKENHGTVTAVLQRFEFPPKQELKLKLKDMLEDEVDEKYYLSEEKLLKIANWKAYQKPFEKVQGKNSIVPTLTARGAGEEHSGMITYSENLEDTTNLQEECLKIGLFDDTSSDNFAKGKRDYGYRNEYGTLKCNPKYSIYKNTNLRIRKLTPKECWRLMGFDDEDFEKAAFKKETSYIEGGLKCNAKLKIVNEKQRHLDMETYASCTTSDMLDMETPIQTKWKKSIENENNEKMQNVNIAIEMLDEVEQKKCVANIIKCGENTEILYTLMEELDQHHMAIIELGKRGKANIEKYMKITLEENLNPMKLYTISTLIKQIIKSKIYTCITHKANIQGNIAIIEDCVKNLKIMKLLNLKMDYITRLNSDTMLYKQAGNSICVPVLMAIFKELIK